MIKSDNGFTLPELTVTIVLIGLVILLVITMILWASKSFQAAGEQSVLHKELRTEANYITSQIRDARSLEILSELTEEGLSEEHNYIYLEDGKIKKRVSIKSSKYVPTGTEVYITDLNFYTSGNNLIEFTITGELKKGKRTREYTIESNVVAENLPEDESIIGEGGSAIKYKPKPLEEVE